MAEFTGGSISSGGSIVPLHEVDPRRKLLERFADLLRTGELETLPFKLGS